MDRETRKLINQSIGQGDNSRYKARFFMHKVPDGENDTIIKAQKLADEKAQRKTDIVGKYQAPDYSPKSLIRLGAKQTHKLLLYVEIKRVGAKDYRSMLATEGHKQEFETEYNKFLSENKANEQDIREERKIIRIDTSGQFNNPSQVPQGFGSFNYTFNI